MTEKIHREAAKELIDESEFGFVIVGEIEEIPTLGNIKPSEQKIRVKANVYEFGTNPEEVSNDDE